jgi:hypothetical protein
VSTELRELPYAKPQKNRRAETYESESGQYPEGDSREGQRGFRQVQESTPQARMRKLAMAALTGILLENRTYSSHENLPYSSDRALPLATYGPHD